MIRTALFFVCILLLGCPSLQAATISGQVEVLKKGGKKKLSDYSYAIIFIEGISTPPPETPAKSVQINKSFVPRLLPVIKGQVVEFWNGDKIQHNVFMKDNRISFDLQTYSRGEYRPYVFDQLGIFKIYCNIHQKMVSDIIVLENHFFSVTDEKGIYSISDIPKGRYTLKVWHIYGGKESKEVIIENSNSEHHFTLTSKYVVKDLKKHTNKFGRKYSETNY